MVDNNDDPITSTATTITRIMARFDWRLMRVDDMRTIIADLRAAEQPCDPATTVLQVYSDCLYAACAGQYGETVRERAFTELHRYLYLISYRHTLQLTPEQRQDVVNDAVLAVWQHFPEYHIPEAFLASAGYELLNAYKPYREYRYITCPLEYAELLPAQTAATDPEQVALHHELHRTIRGCFRRMMRRRPRSRKQLAAVWLKYMRDIDDKAIGEHFAQSVANIHVLRSRGLKRLRDDATIRSAFRSP